MRYLLYALTHPFEKRAYVKPHGDHWIVEQLTFTDAFFDDALYYGLRVALHNLWYTLTTPPNHNS